MALNLADSIKCDYEEYTLKLWDSIEQTFRETWLPILEKYLDGGAISPNLVKLNEIRRILVVKQHDKLGDFLVCTPVFRALREFFPQAYIAVIMRTDTEKLAHNNPYLNKLFVVPEKLLGWTPARIWRLFRGLRSGWDLTIVLNSTSISVTSDLLAYFSGASYILGSEQPALPGCKRNFFYNLVAPYNSPKHQTDRYLDIVRYLGINTENLGEVMSVTSEERKAARNFMYQYEIFEEDIVIALHPGASADHNRWPVEKFAELANILYHCYKVRILVAWGPEECSLGLSLCQYLTFSPIIASGFTIRQLAALLTNVDLFVCNDTGVMHVAAAINAKVVAIFGPSNPDEWGPIGENIVIVRGEKDRCESVSVQQVLSAIQTCLAINGHSSKKTIVYQRVQDLLWLRV